MAELRATDIIGKLRKINDRIKELESGSGITEEFLKEQGVVFEVKVNDTSYSPTNGLVDLGKISGVVCAYIKTPLINIHDYSVADRYILSTDVKKDNIFFIDYNYYTITSQNGNNSYGINENEAATYFGAMIGSKYIPRINQDEPQYHYMITEGGDVFLPIFYQNTDSSYSEIRLYIIRWISNTVKEYVTNIKTTLEEQIETKVSKDERITNSDILTILSK